MNYKGYPGKVEYDYKNRIFRGKVIGINSILTFEGVTVDEIEQGFKRVIDGYLDRCKAEEKRAEKSYSGTFNLRIPPELHAQLSLHAKIEDMSLNSYIAYKLEGVNFDD